jgi:hypothetical protein
MPKTDEVPCFYREQDDTWEKPAQTLLRTDVRTLKDAGLGKFENHGRTFRLFAFSPSYMNEISLQADRNLSHSAPGESDSSISLAEMQANLGIVSDGLRHPRAFVRRAQEKIKAWPHIFDEQALLARGFWPLSPLEVAVQQ